jgi:hypothetical protein
MNYFETYFEHLGNNLKSVNDITKFTNNPDVIGQYAEMIVLDFLLKFISPLKATTGSVISPDSFNKKQMLPQVDLILWDSNPLPAIFDIQGFGLIPKNSVFGILEIKRTDYLSGLKDIQKRYANRHLLLPIHEIKNADGEETKLSFEDNFLAIICVSNQKNTEKSKPLIRTIRETNNKTIYLTKFDKSANKVEINHKGILELVNFISTLKKRNKDFGKDYSIEPWVLDQ